MIRRARWIVLAIVVVVIAVALAGALLVRPDLVDARDRVDARWDEIRSSLVKRYDALGAVADALDAAGASDRAVTRDLRRALGRWTEVSARPKSDPALEATVANELEALARRVEANRTASDRLRGNKPLADAVLAFHQQVVPPPGVRAYNRAVDAYESTRDGTFERLVAGVLGFEARPKLFLEPG